MIPIILLKRNKNNWKIYFFLNNYNLVLAGFPKSEQLQKQNPLNNREKQIFLIQS